MGFLAGLFGQKAADEDATLPPFDPRCDQTVMVRVIQVEPDELRRICQGCGGEKSGGGCHAMDGNTHVIHIAKFKAPAFTDYVTLQCLGHEMMHALGYEHGKDD